MELNHRHPAGNLVSHTPKTLYSDNRIICMGIIHASYDLPQQRATQGAQVTQVCVTNRVCLREEGGKANAEQT